MANTLTNLVPDVYAALDVVSRELVGCIPTFARDATTDRAAKNQAVRVFQTRGATVSDVTPGVTPPDDGDQTVDNVSVTITKVRRAPIRWNGEDTLGVNSNGPGQLTILQDQIAQSIRAICNEMEVDCYNAARIAVSRAYGTAGTTPFVSDLSDPANVRKIMDDNGAPMSDRAMIINTTAGAKMRTLSQLTKANEAGATMTLRSGELMDLHGFSVHESAAVKANTAGTGSGYLINNSGGYAIGDTALTVDTGTGTILAGDVITLAGDTNKYVVASALSSNVVTIAKPGLLKAHADNDAITVSAIFTANLAYVRSAMVLAARLPALPPNGDLAVDRTTITDPRSGISFELAMYPQYRQMQYEISAAWGAAGIKAAHGALLLG